MGTDEFAETCKETDAPLSEIVGETSSGAESSDGSATPWHMAAEEVIEYVVTANALPSDAGGVHVIKESQLDVTMKDTRIPDVCVALSEGVKITGPIGGYLRARSTIEYKSPTDVCSLETIMRSGIYTLGYALDSTDGERNELCMSCNLSSIIVCAHKPRKLFHDLKRAGLHVETSEDYKGVYLLEDASFPKTMFVVPSELDLTQAAFQDVKGYEWFKWLRNDLSVDDGRALMRRRRNATGMERELATTVAYVALQGNPSVMKILLEDTNMSDDVRKVIRPLVREEFAKELDAMEKERDEAVDAAVQEKDAAVQEKDAAVQKMDKARQIISDIIAASADGSIDPSALLEAQEFLATAN